MVFYSFCKGPGCREGVSWGEEVGAYMVVVGVVIGQGLGEAPVPSLAHLSAVLTALITADVSGWRGK